MSDSAQIAAGLVIYWVLGMAWLAEGLLPRPLGWLKHDMPPFVAAIFVVIGGTIWPLILGKIIWRCVWHGEENVRL